MNGADKHPRDAEAFEYVLGTGSLDERRAFGQDMAGDPALAAAVRRWEADLAGLTAAVPPVTPSAGLYAAIERRLGGSNGADVVSMFAGLDVIRLRRSRALWRAAATATSALAAALAIYVAADRVGTVPAGSGLVAVVNRSGDLPALIVRVDRRSGVVQVRAVATEAAPAGHSLELWSVVQGSPPRSLGLVASGSARTSLPANGTLAEGVTLAVSVEPAGGSPTGGPTGPVVYSGRLIPETP